MLGPRRQPSLLLSLLVLVMAAIGAGAKECYQLVNATSSGFQEVDQKGDTYGPGNAIDGDKATFFASQDIAETGLAWFQVQLFDETDEGYGDGKCSKRWVTRVLLGHEEGKPPKDVLVTVGNDPFEFVAPMDKGPIICHHKKGPLVMITYTVFLCDKGLRGKYVGVHTRSRSAAFKRLSFAEIYVETSTDPNINQYNNPDNDQWKRPQISTSIFRGETAYPEKKRMVVSPPRRGDNVYHGDPRKYLREEMLAAAGYEVKSKGPKEVKLSKDQFMKIIRPFYEFVNCFVGYFLLEGMWHGALALVAWCKEGWRGKDKKRDKKEDKKKENVKEGALKKKTKTRKDAKKAEEEKDEKEGKEDEIKAVVEAEEEEAWDCDRGKKGMEGIKKKSKEQEEEEVKKKEEKKAKKEEKREKIRKLKEAVNKAD